MMTTKEKIARAHTIDRDGTDWWEVWTDLSLSKEDAREIIAWAQYEVERTWWTTHRAAQRRAMRLLRSMLSADQKRQLRGGSCKAFRVTGSSGGVFKIYPHAGQGGLVRRVELHGQRWYEVAQHCFHTPRRDVPPADEAIGFMLLLRANETEFMLRSNETIRPPIGWQRAIERGASTWKPSWLTADDIGRALSEMMERRHRAREAYLIARAAYEDAA